ncbi:hypothetical protein K491DRAFT_696458 [Lophiostoma macrostomum CBS 122681]|uniref:tRNA(Phe) (4-demethylwyosine(37)-C(7)) aminocarboxypropyltransferase n=1 Tax=Lophiostoma macrostomum CBS 122681 TaxID=1314788 RepID=A0A6A6SWN4_9PLEO|nr:hypothetical protein K491DRAFT_696458 [Lophiostoma macrostomum CBS 122681]
MAPDTTQSPRIAFLVSKQHMQRVKTALYGRNLFDRTSRISAGGISVYPELNTYRPCIPTTISIAKKEDWDLGARDIILRDLGLEDLKDDINISVGYPAGVRPPRTGPRNPLTHALTRGFAELPDEILGGIGLDATALVAAFPTTYSVYKPMLLLPAHAFSSAPWIKLLAIYPVDSPVLQPIWERIATALNTTHIAINAGIPLQRSSTSSSTSTSTPTPTANRTSPSPPTPQYQSSYSPSENTFRSPINLTPIHGAFGPTPTQERMLRPTTQDFSSALWDETRQNGITQVWAPRYTMFSRGNVREKTRVLALGAVGSASATPLRKPKSDADSEPASAVANGSIPGDAEERKEKRNGEARQHEHEHEHNYAAAAADLYAGIGYFAFSYKRAGVRQVLCWEVNPWSIEGLRRGCERNGWSYRIVASPLPSPSISTSMDRRDGEVARDETEAEKEYGYGYEQDEQDEQPRPRDVQAGTQTQGQARDVDFIIFPRTNENAIQDLRQWNSETHSHSEFGEHSREDKQRLRPSIRHVNCGFLPTSQKSWKTAVQLLDTRIGGWIHAHENVGMHDIEQREEEVVRIMQGLVEEVDAGDCTLETNSRTEKRKRMVSCEHVEQVKTYAPGVVHVVFDVRVEGRDEVDGVQR